MSILSEAIESAIMSVEDGQASFVFTTNSPVFAGHFPARPVLPAVVQLQMVQAILARQGGKSCLHSVKQAKFVAPIGPSLPVELQIEQQTEIEGLKSVKAILRSPLGVHAKIQMTVE